MSFAPLPEHFTDFLRQLQYKADTRILDLGSGEGLFPGLVSHSFSSVWGLDRRHPYEGASWDLCADAGNPPLLNHSLDALVAGNLVRHLLVQNSSTVFLSLWLNLLKPGGRLYIFEDHPEFNPGPAFNYQRLQKFLAKLMPGQRAELLKRESFVEIAQKECPSQKWVSGLQFNNTEPNFLAVSELLAPDGIKPAIETDVGALLADIENQGISYGRYWWASAQVESVMSE
ncbi:MAG: class I SAM-dependent methyltransferase [bacterium]|nr:class I SAM-dependent methyltransferase [bacterium]